MIDPALSAVPLFAPLDAEEFAAVSALMERRFVEAGETVFHEGDLGDDLFVLLSGALRAYRVQADGVKRRMFDIGPGTFLGEMSIIAGEPRSATITALEDSTLAALHGGDFFRIIFARPLLGIKLLSSIAGVQNTWLDQTARHLRELVTWGETARRRAVTDELTGLYNRTFLEESIREAFRTGLGPRQTSLIMIDLDRVHGINERYGVSAGDKVLTAAAEVLKSTTRPGDIAARLSGDEYAVFLPDTGVHGAFRVAERIRQGVMKSRVSIPAEKDSCGMMKLEIRASLGIASAPHHAVNEKGLFDAADRALRTAKEEGRNRVALAS
jgi:diguanylate cyclase (GGDEF)-like protein